MRKIVSVGVAGCKLFFHAGIEILTSAIHECALTAAILGFEAEHDIALLLIIQD